ncbi:protein tramtrack, beta isoform-like [Penaeus monodon]|uniref:protein tramtrack, beta isoform-like n=1 Tax=Penaeus monodon TaxID=6687 RepID=UPI0018A7D79C|nr:protein tramtrack, beta isoform-like [Penaeus monodon]
MKFTHVSQLVNFMYRGEINITQDMLSGLLKTAETLKVKGLAEVSGDQPAQVANPMPPILRLAASSHGPRFVTQEMLQHSRQASLPQMVPPNSSPLTTALNAPMVAPPTLAPLAALLNPEPYTHHDQTRPRRDKFEMEHVSTRFWGDGSACGTCPHVIRQEGVKGTIPN